MTLEQGGDAGAAAARGALDVVQEGLVRGWAVRGDGSGGALRLCIRVDGAVIGMVVAEAYREDLAAAGIGDGCHGFVLEGGIVRLPAGGCEVTVEDAASGQVLLRGRGAGAEAPLEGGRAEGVGSDGGFEGYVDHVSFDRVRGWAWYPDRPLDAVTIRVRADGRVIGRVVANVHRADVAQAGYGTGQYGFDLAWGSSPALGPCVIEVEDEATGAALTHSPARLEGRLELDGPVSVAISALFESPGGEDDLRARALFAGRHADHLIQRLSDARSRSGARLGQRARKWRWRAEDGPEPARVPARALVIDHAMPCPGRDAGSNALLSHMASLQRLGFELLFAPADMRDDGGGAMLEEMGVQYAVEPWCASVEEVMRREGHTFDLVYIHRYEAAARYVPMARHTMPQARRIYSVADLHGLRLARQGEVEERPELVAHGQAVHQLELAAAAGCHVVVTHSPVEAAILGRSLGADRVEVVPWHVAAQPTPAGHDGRSGLAFVGSYRHAPNLDGALWLRDEVLPLVWRAAPEIVCTLAGSDMPETLGGTEDGRIRAAGRVESLAGLLGQMRLTVAPLAYGAGLKGKVLDSLGLGVPCVCTPIAAEGFLLPPPLRDLVAGDAAGLAASIVRLHREPRLFEACREAGLAYVSGAFSEAVVDAGLRRAAGLHGLPAGGAGLAAGQAGAG